jgi:medium-chain acyl-[acyl-carrier-protein] hydrolase
MPDDELVAALESLLGPNEYLADAAVRELFLPVLRADLALAESYRHEPRAPLACPIVAFTGHDDRHVPADDVDAWREHTHGAFRCIDLDSDHMRLLHKPEVLVEIRRALDIRLE